jgi:nucleoside-diphosphate-sugar epimerase
MNIVITGSRGFLGKHALRFLSANAHDAIRVITYDEKGNQWDRLNGADVILHLAGVNRDTGENIMEGNVGFTKSLLQKLSSFAPKAKIIFSSSSQVYMSGSLYGRAKLEAENLIRAHTQQYGAESVILRFSNIYGPFCRPFYNSVIATFVFQAMHDKELTVNGKGEQKRDYLYVDDAVSAIDKALRYNSAEGGVILDVCSKEMHSVNEIIDVIRKLSAKSIRTKYINNPDNVVYKSSDGKLSAQEVLDWRPQVTLPHGIENIIKEEYETIG